MGKDETEKTGRASDEYKGSFWNAMRVKAPMPSVLNALQEGTDSEGGYLVPDEFERTVLIRNLMMHSARYLSVLTSLVP